MLTFPTLSANPAISGYANTIAHDPTMRNETEGGYVVTRARFTRLVGKWHVVYNVLKDTDKTSLDTFENNVKVGSDAFYWTEPVTSTQKVVRFLSPIQWSRNSLYWKCEFDLEEV